MARSLSSVPRSLTPAAPSRPAPAGLLWLLALSLAACATPQPAPPAVAGAGTEAEAGDDGAMTPDRLEQILKVQARDVQREGDDAVRDLVWTLLNTHEFRFIQ